MCAPSLTFCLAGTWLILIFKPVGICTNSWQCYSAWPWTEQSAMCFFSSLYQMSVLWKLTNVEISPSHETFLWSLNWMFQKKLKQVYCSPLDYCYHLLMPDSPGNSSNKWRQKNLPQSHFPLWLLQPCSLLQVKLPRGVWLLPEQWALPSAYSSLLLSFWILHPGIHLDIIFQDIFL